MYQSFKMFKDEDFLFWISGNTPSSKNNRVFTGSFFIASKQVQDWRKKTRLEWLGQALWFQYLASMLPRPLYIELTFYRGTRHKFDYINMAQVVLDEMKGYLPHDRIKIKNSNKNVANWDGKSEYKGDYYPQLYWIEEDNADVVKPFFGDYHYDKKHPGVVIRLLTSKPQI